MSILTGFYYSTFQLSLSKCFTEYNYPVYGFNISPAITVHFLHSLGSIPASSLIWVKQLLLLLLLSLILRFSHKDQSAYNRYTNNYKGTQNMWPSSSKPTKSRQISSPVITQNSHLGSKIGILKVCFIAKCIL